MYVDERLAMIILPENAETRARAARIIADGGIVAYRTDTFYGLGADPCNRNALRTLFDLKGREEGKPILLLISDEREVARFVAERTPLFDAISARHWPGALTLVARARSDVPAELTAKTKTIGLRLPNDADVRNFVRACGGALTATSANISGSAPARTAAEVARAFSTGLTLIVDGGEARIDQPSTVLDVTGTSPHLIREGAVSWQELQHSQESDV